MLFHPQKLINMHMYDNQLFANVEDLNVWIRCCIYGIHFTWLVSLSRRRKNTFNAFLACIDICITCLYFKAFLSLHVLSLSLAEASLCCKERDKESARGGGGGWCVIIVNLYVISNFNFWEYPTAVHWFVLCIQKQSLIRCFYLRVGRGWGLKK